MVIYLPHETRIRRRMLSWQRQGLQETASGYGTKLTTSLQAEYCGRWYRVYCTCYSNVGSCYIISKGQRLYLHDSAQCDETQ
jgi:hypothetical protein